MINRNETTHELYGLYHEGVKELRQWEKMDKRTRYAKHFYIFAHAKESQARIELGRRGIDVANCTAQQKS